MKISELNMSPLDPTEDTIVTVFAQKADGGCGCGGCGCSAGSGYPYTYDRSVPHISGTAGWGQSLIAAEQGLLQNINKEEIDSSLCFAKPLFMKPFIQF